MYYCRMLEKGVRHFIARCLEGRGGLRTKPCPRVAPGNAGKETLAHTASPFCSLTSPPGGRPLALSPFSLKAAFGKELMK